jgi:hypothetical protein
LLLTPYPVIPKLKSIEEDSKIVVSSSVASERQRLANDSMTESLEILTKKVQPLKELNLDSVFGVVKDPDEFCNSPLIAKKKLLDAFENKFYTILTGDEFRDKWATSADNDKSRMNTVIKQSVVEKYYQYQRLVECCDD